AHPKRARLVVAMAGAVVAPCPTLRPARRVVGDGRVVGVTARPDAPPGHEQPRAIRAHPQRLPRVVAVGGPVVAALPELRAGRGVVSERRVVAVTPRPG